MAFGDFLKKIGEVFTPPKRIRDWRKRKRLYRRYLENLGQDPETVRSGVRAWIKNNPKPKRTKKEREKIYSDIPQLYEEGKELFGGNGGNGIKGVKSPTLAGPVRTVPALGGINPLFYLALVPIVFPKQFKKFFNIK